ncbi:MAG: aminoacyl-tRNA hydrolase [Parachlamydiaceae bacterium]
MEQTEEAHYVVVGLGNPGQKYEFTRHNIGYLVGKALARVLGFTLKEEKRFHALVAKGRYQGKVLHLVLPLTYMNASGRAVEAYLNFYKLGPKALIVVCDDVELPFGQLRLRAKGSSGGHNGLKSIESHLGTRDYLRLKMGVGKELQSATLAEYVLDLFKPEELANLETFIVKAMEVVKSLMSEPEAIVMNKVNVSIGNQVFPLKD